MLTRKHTRYSISAPDMPRLVSSLTSRYSQQWYQFSTENPELGREYSGPQQSANEKDLASKLDQLYRELKRPPRTEIERRVTQEHISATITGFVQKYLSLEDEDIETIRSFGFAEIAADFAQKARNFHPGLSDENIFQASRNVWSMNFMQVLLGLPVELTPSIFAFSMLYPITDNYLDDPSISPKMKRAFNQRFQKRILGEPVEVANPQEQEINDLIGMIEDQFDRSRYPQVYDSLLAIHVAQSHSLELLTRPFSPYEVDVLGICMEKGGTSVIADGFLTAGDLTDDQIEFMYLYGILTQLIDDLEDVGNDLEAGLMTIFSMTANHWPLDAITNRTFHLANYLMDAMDIFNAPGALPFKNLLHRSLTPVLLAEVGSARQYFTISYRNLIERHFPYRFAFIDKQRQKLERQKVTLMSLVELFSNKRV